MGELSKNKLFKNSPEVAALAALCTFESAMTPFVNSCRALSIEKPPPLNIFEIKKLTVGYYMENVLKIYFF